MTQGQKGWLPPTKADGREELLELYRVHVAEYRFQVELNWKRSQYFLALNLAVLAAGGGLLGGSSSISELAVAVSVFIAGIATAVLAYKLISWQHEYYRNARTRMLAIGEELDLGQWGMGTTPAMGGSHIPKGKITSRLKRTVAVLGILDVVGVLMASAALLPKLCST